MSDAISAAQSTGDPTGEERLDGERHRGPSGEFWHPSQSARPSAYNLERLNTKVLALGVKLPTHRRSLGWRGYKLFGQCTAFILHSQRFTFPSIQIGPASGSAPNDFPSREIVKYRHQQLKKECSPQNLPSSLRVSSAT
jgi:hypothetical protein